MFANHPLALMRHCEMRTEELVREAAHQRFAWDALRNRIQRPEPQRTSTALPTPPDAAVPRVRRTQPPASALEPAAGD
jgi:hypothetical protein